MIRKWHNRNRHSAFTPSPVIFMPMIGMDPSDMSCIYSTLKFVAKRCDKLSVTPVIIFDQSLYFTALTIVVNETIYSDFKRVTQNDITIISLLIAPK